MSITAELLHPNTSGSGGLGTEDLPWGNIHGVQIFKNGLPVATLQSPALTGTPTAPTVASTSDNSTKIATTAFVQAVLAALEIDAIGEVSAAEIAAHLADGTIHLTAEQVRDLVATFAAGGNTLSVTHNDGSDTLTFAVRLKTNGGLTSDADGISITFGTSGTTACAGNDARLPTSTEKAGFRKHNFTATADPAVTDDTGDGYGVGSVWTNINETPVRVFMCVDATADAAEWERLNSAVSAAALDEALADALVSSDTVQVIHDTDNDQFSFEVIPKSASLGALEQALMNTASGIVGVLGQTANTACAGDDGRLRKHKFDATADPTVNDDTGDGYQIGSVWVRSATGAVWVATDVSTGAAVWLAVGGGLSGLGASDNRLVRTNGTAGTAAQNSAITCDDSGNLTGVGTLNTHTIPGGTGTLALASAISTGANDNRILRSDGTGGGTLQASAVTLDDSGNMSGVGTLAASGAVTLSSTLAVTGNTTLTANLSVGGQAYSPTHTLTDAATVATDCNNGNVFVVTLGGNRTFGAPTNQQSGATYIWRIIQDGTGNRTATWNSVFKWPGGTDGVLSTAAGAIDIVSGVSDGTNVYVTIQKAFS